MYIYYRQELPTELWIIVVLYIPVRTIGLRQKNEIVNKNAKKVTWATNLPWVSITSRTSKGRRTSPKGWSTTLRCRNRAWWQTSINSKIKIKGRQCITQSLTIFFIESKPKFNASFKFMQIIISYIITNTILNNVSPYFLSPPSLPSHISWLLAHR